MRRREVIAGLAATAAGWPLAAGAQNPARPYVILWVSTDAQPDPFIEGFRDGMRALGYVEGENLAFVLRYAPGDPGRGDGGSGGGDGRDGRDGAAGRGRRDPR